MEALEKEQEKIVANINSKKVSFENLQQKPAALNAGLMQASRKTMAQAEGIASMA